MKQIIAVVKKIVRHAVRHPLATIRQLSPRNLFRLVEFFRYGELDNFDALFALYGGAGQVPEGEPPRPPCALAQSSDSRPTILVIDQQVPHFDADAGARATYQYLQLFCSLGMRVLFLGDTFNRDEPYATLLEREGVELLAGDWYRRNWRGWLERNGRYIDFVYLNRPRISRPYVAPLRRHTRAMLIYQGHDLHFLRLRRKFEIVGGKRLLKQARFYEQLERDLVGRCDRVFTFSQAEKELMERAWGAANVQVVPLHIYGDLAAPTDGFAVRRDLLFVGSFAHAPNVDAVTWFVRDILPIVRRHMPEVRLVVVGSKATDAVRALASDCVIVAGRVDDRRLGELYRQSRLVVVPMRYGAGMKGKVLEAFRYGVPIVATSIALEGMPQIGGLISPQDAAEAFAAEVVGLYRDQRRWERMSAGEIDYLREHFSREAACRIVADVLGLEACR